jgi:DNA polymerase-3 subunit gamma/tau
VRAEAASPPSPEPVHWRAKRESSPRSEPSKPPEILTKPANVENRSPTTDDWDALIRRAELGGPLGQFARQATLVAIEGSLVRLALKAAHEHLAVGPLVAQLEQKLGSALGGKIKIKFERDNGVAESPADLQTRTETTRRQAAEDSLRSDPFVQSLEQTFGARVITNSVRPVDGEAR